MRNILTIDYSWELGKLVDELETEGTMTEEEILANLNPADERNNDDDGEVDKFESSSIYKGRIFRNSELFHI